MKKPQYAVSVAIHGDIDHRAGDVPEWCDLSVNVTSTEHQSTWVSAWDEEVTLYMTREAGQAVIDAAFATLHPYAGQSIVQLMERDLDAVVDRLLFGKAQEDDKALARGMAMMVAILHKPLNPDWEAIRDACVARVTAKHEVSKPTKSAKRGTKS